MLFRGREDQELRILRSNRVSRKVSCSPRYNSSIGLLPHVSHCQGTDAISSRGVKELREIDTQILRLVSVRVEEQHSDGAITQLLCKDLGNQPRTRLSNAILWCGEVDIRAKQHANVAACLGLIETHINGHALLGMIDSKLLGTRYRSICRGTADSVPAVVVTVQATQN